MKMKVFKFDVDEAFAKRHNEMLRDSRRLLVSGLLLGEYCSSLESSLRYSCNLYGALLWGSV